ncbi:MAG: anaerobic ribonucleoside-triphosphate reductase activating protein [Omnitrophica WOR_2 bacterium GWF2_38_59]|nr:MAG: anaerobic ribonucleoside-triphosphate reductase activating protein [Omnitrophica WOR_2 bacterium GWF2_38_59]OGX48215.1 MAG: anaerobic ribonucleoside-triphosphate reductase activating protein [Omnitrophica WOR_2 bacterium RIFOXYA2_FULL_38_17]OGX53901.1 MAG: anaerobic ribonucleoside-triphosphate reductase activating protein [Omnitrophica WOR_2 bacterium RIFOXYA12_FULL_38_10]OGX59620.1 MAG: anaerobic ribonucleoside-triphosphate reductase activating protein [Omnitrophica WOR_2 bacterium RIFO
MSQSLLLTTYIFVMNIGGLQKLTIIDFPGHIAAVIFLQGCNFRCPYCHNPELVDPKQFQETIDQNEVLSFLATRKEKLTGVVITGGEPCIHEGLVGFIKKIKDMGFLVKLDTNGSRPDVLKNVIDKKLVDFIAMDVKAPLEKYFFVTKVKGFENKVKESIRLVMDSGIRHEFRTTVARTLLDENDIVKIKELVENDDSYRTQDFVNGDKILDPTMLE